MVICHAIEYAKRLYALWRGIFHDLVATLILVSCVRVKPLNLCQCASDYIEWQRSYFLRFH